MSNNTKSKLQRVSRLLFWFCFAVVSAYILLSIFFFLLGNEQFGWFQTEIFSVKAVYLVPFLLIAGSAGMIYFKNQEKTRFLKRNSVRKFTPVFASALTVCLLALAVNYLVFPRLETENHNTNSSWNIVIPDSSTSVIAAASTTSVPSGKTAQVPKKVLVKDTIITPPTREAMAANRPTFKSESDRMKYSTTEVKYQVLSKAYLYNEPDESTRRNAYINAGNSYATLLPKNEKDGFIFVVFTTDNGQTTMGWVNKKNLRPVHELVYNSDK